MSSHDQLAISQLKNQTQRDRILELEQERDKIEAQLSGTDTALEMKESYIAQLEGHITKLRNLGREMRDAQVRYFKTRNPQTPKESKELERKFDNLCTYLEDL